MRMRTEKCSCELQTRALGLYFFFSTFLFILKIIFKKLISKYRCTCMDFGLQVHLNPDPDMSGFIN